ncbi:MAG: hypothetical protein EXS33_00310 [Pedosphaera sp.]|nr:hypothetical protein [Pedosphaera sp.]
MKPEDLLDPAEFPDDLKWVAAHHNLHPTDPVYLLVAWHWRRVKQSEDTLKAAIVELKAALDIRLEAITEAAETVTGVNEALAGVQDALEEKPAQLEAQLEAKLSHPLANALAQLHALEKSLTPLARTFQMSQRRQLLAALLVGVTLGVLSAVIVLLA